MYYFKDDYCREHLFWFPKEWVESMAWAVLCKAGKTVLPVICAHCNKDGLAFPGIKRIAILSGLSTKQTGEGIKALKGFPGVTIERQDTRHGRQPNRYTIELLNKGGFPFYTSIFHSGIWRMLSPTARALYPVLRCYGGFNGEDVMDYYIFDKELDAPGNDEDDFRDIFRNREWEFCGESQIFLSERAGIHRTRFKPAVTVLEDNNLIIEPCEDYLGDSLTVRLKPDIYYKRPCMNLETKKRYAKSN